ncbi:M23 family metallopeptidase [Xanthobacter oligotrophicus]|uniref:M23 family metallopeptidase n=1 Tax=Xanthobacter oligotrophicus TaxID=2607286 RepID=A0ABW6ZR05_9HYPH
MRISSETHGHNVFARLALIGLVSGTVAGCSADSTRFLTDGFTAPPQQQANAGYAGGYQGQPGGGQGGGDVTGSLGAAPSGRVDSVPLPPPGQGGAGMQPSSYAAPGATQPLYGASGYGATAPAPVTASTRPAVPGTHVVVGGETLASVARMYGVSPAALGAANNIAPGNTVRTGQTLVIPPGGNGASQAHAAVQPVTAAKPPQVAAGPNTLTVPGKPASQPATVAAKPLTTAPVLSQNLTPPPASPAPVVTASVKPAPATKPGAAPTQAVAKSSAPEPKVETAAKVTPADDADDGPRASGSGPQFRAPVRGRVIASFGPKPGGAHNDGVNFAVPEGTGVRAAEDGTVAYAGNELKGYGNLVLVKHADGYVTAYAHNSELNVKRGDTVRRGQIIAKAGQSGNVNSPQLHFEIRKGSTAVDPSRYVAGL